MRRRLVAILVVFAAGAVIAFVVWRKRRAAHEPELVVAAHAREVEMTRVVDLDPWPLEARIGPGWTCSDSDTGPSCAKGDLGVTWRLEVETNGAPIDALIARNEETIATLDVAGFHGVVNVSESHKMPVTEMSFDGWAEDPANKRRLKLHAGAYQWRSPDEVNVDLAGALAVMLTTSVRPSGVMVTLPNVQEMHVEREARTAFRVLVDDGASARWRESISDMVHPFESSLAEAWAPRKKAVAELFARRALGASGDVATLDIAEAFSRAAWIDHDTGGRVARIVEHRFTRPEILARADAATWVNAATRSANMRAGFEKNDDALAELARHLDSLDRAVVLRAPGDVIDKLGWHTRVPEVSALLARWLAPADFPEHADFAALAKSTLAAFGRGGKPIQSHVVGMLKSRQKATGDARVCDVYARAAVDQHFVDEFDASWPLARRDAAIREILTHFE